MFDTPFSRLASLGEQLERTKSRNDLAALLAGFLTELSPEEIAPSVRMTIGMVFPEWDGRTLGVSWTMMMAAVDRLVAASSQVREAAWSQAVDGGEGVRLLLERARAEPPAPPRLTILEVFRTFEELADISGPGSRARKEFKLVGVLRRASPVEAKFMTKVIYQEMRHGVSEGIMMEGIAQAAGVKAQRVRRANQLWGDLGEVALVALTAGEDALSKATVQLFRPIKPMLAQTADSLDEVHALLGGRLALEHKLDGARVQIHRRSDVVRIYSRNLSDVTVSLPDVVSEVRHRLVPQEAILDGEAVAVDGEGRPLPFQHLMRRFRRKHDIESLVQEVPVQLHLFDALYIDGTSLIDSPNEDRWAALEQAAGGLGLVQRETPQGITEARAFAQAAHRAGHEGVMAKDLRSRYTPGGRGKRWFKIKHIMSVDLVIVAADWGYGRRHGWLSNYHLAARDTASGELRVVGKTYKGLADAEFQQMTELLLGLERSRQGGTVRVQPSVVVEVLFNEIQESKQYRSGFALRFARISRIRTDKHAKDADTLQALRELYDRQFRYKGRPG